MMEMDTRHWCGTGPERAVAIENGTRDMNEPTLNRSIGSDAARSGWHVAPDRVDAPRPDAARPEDAPVQRPAPIPATTDVERAPAHKDIGSAAVFSQSYARFEINDKTKRLSIKIVDAATDQVIREIPSEEVQRIAEELQALARRGTIGRRPAGDVRGPTASGGVDSYV